MLPVLKRRSRLEWESPLDLLRREWGPVFDQVLEGDGGTRTWSAAYPVDIREDDDNLYVEAEMPGFTREQIDVSLEGGILSISGERKEREERKGEQRHLTERRYTRVARSFTLPVAIDEKKVEARLEEGVLKLRLPKAEQVKPRRIAIA